VSTTTKKKAPNAANAPDPAAGFLAGLDEADLEDRIREGRLSDDERIRLRPRLLDRYRRMVADAPAGRIKGEAADAHWLLKALAKTPRDLRRDVAARQDLRARVHVLDDLDARRASAGEAAKAHQAAVAEWEELQRAWPKRVAELQKERAVAHRPLAEAREVERAVRGLIPQEVRTRAGLAADLVSTLERRLEDAQGELRYLEETRGRIVRTKGGTLKRIADKVTGTAAAEQKALGELGLPDPDDPGRRPRVDVKLEQTRARVAALEGELAKARTELAAAEAAVAEARAAVIQELRG